MRRACAKVSRYAPACGSVTVPATVPDRCTKATTRPPSGSGIAAPSQGVPGVAKPEPAIYQELLKRLRLGAAEVVFIDDRAENVAAAASLGMHVIWYLGAAELERQIEVYLSPGALQACEAEDRDG